MIAISLWQPWASAIACGLKTIETRGWAARCVGSRIAIHAAKRNTPELRAWCMQYVKGCTEQSELNAGYFARIGVKDFVALPFGAIVCTATLAAVEPTEKLGASGRVPAGSLEYEWGNFAAIDDDTGRPRYGWILHGVSPVTPPAVCRGWQNFFTWDPKTNQTMGLAPSWKGVEL